MEDVIGRMFGGMMSMCAELDPFHVVDPPSCREGFIVYLEGLGSDLEEALHHLAAASESFVLTEELLEADVVVLGNRDWSEESIGRVLAERADDLPMFLPLEALLPCLILGLHPRHLPEECLIEFGRDHPAIVHMVDSSGQRHLKKARGIAHCWKSIGRRRACSPTWATTHARGAVG